ncbi:MerR family transcriptional regulator [Bacillus velezensis]
MTQIPKRQYTPGEVSKILEIDNETLKKWVTEFNVSTERTGGGHRRYSGKNVEELKAIKEKIRDEGWSWKQVQQWRNGELDAFVSHQEKSELEKKLDYLITLREQDQELMAEMAKAVLESQKEVKALKEYIENKETSRDQELTQSLNLLLEQKKEKQNKGFLARLFAK